MNLPMTNPVHRLGVPTALGLRHQMVQAPLACWNETTAQRADFAHCLRLIPRFGSLLCHRLAVLHCVLNRKV
ncbi:hypothetical protein AWB67_07128 [Caballeronia terrestris]|uniref:Uncharacterized protein n=1 Tax=Caballeronia terrestris TaxID=1226301 RepID=A0A158KYF7_9BURK|nr:hypothetical protein AWB67_07128 [Caballeronia terrestris]